MSLLLPPSLDATDDPALAWQRCRQAGVVPSALPVPAGAAGAGALALAARRCVLRRAALPVLQSLRAHLSRSAALAVLADKEGVILHVEGDARLRRLGEEIGLQIGWRWQESDCGNNALGSALALGSTVSVQGGEHFCQALRGWAGVGTPIFGLGEGPGVAGCLAWFTGQASPGPGALVVETFATFIENRLLESRGQGGWGVRVQADGADGAEGGERGGFIAPLDAVATWDRAGQWQGGNRHWRASFGRELPGFPEMADQPWAGFLARQAGRPPRVMADDQGRRWLLRVDALPADSNAEGGGPDQGLDSLGRDDPCLAEAIRRAGRIVDCDIPLLIQGETGSGKEWFARAFHHSSRRCAGPFVAVNCAAIPATLIEAELFGHEAGAFTGARRQGAPGKIREADGGTLFLDEIGDMPPALQAVLLRVLETRRVVPLGGQQETTVDIALVCASHQPLRELVARGEFRADLFFRLSGMTVALPPLRERQDFTQVVRRILAEESGGSGVRLAAATLDCLRACPWPGNLRQLRNVLRLGLALLDEGGVLLPEHLPPEVRGDPALPAEHSAPGALRTAQVRLAREAVARHGGNISAAARELGITRTTLYRKLGREG